MEFMASYDIIAALQKFSAGVKEFRIAESYKAAFEFTAAKTTLPHPFEPSLLPTYLPQIGRLE